MSSKARKLEEFFLMSLLEKLKNTCAENFFFSSSRIVQATPAVLSQNSRKRAKTSVVSSHLRSTESEGVFASLRDEKGKTRERERERIEENSKHFL